MLDNSTESVGSKNFDLVSSKPFITTEMYVYTTEMYFSYSTLQVFEPIWKRDNNFRNMFQVICHIFEVINDW